MHLFVFGLGYAGMAVAKAAVNLGVEVTATVRTTANALNLADFGGRIIALDQPQAYPQIVERFRHVTHVLSTVPPAVSFHGRARGEGDPVLGRYLRLMQAARPGWVGYLSATSVYGDTGGAWVDETSPVKPVGARGIARLVAERGWLSAGLSSGLPAHVFRVSGIYGPGASVIEQLRHGVARRLDARLADGTPHVMNRIHVDDLAGAVLASLQKPEAGAIYNLSDDLPAASAEVVSYAAGLLDMDAPPLEPFDAATLSPMQASFYAECKRVDNRKLQERLGYRLIYPTYREGLARLI